MDLQRRRAAAAACALALLPAVRAAGAVVLVTEEEAAASRAAPQPPATRSLLPPDAPRIEVLAPDVSKSIASPTRIRVRFEPVAPASIRAASFRVRYGALRLDITSRITAAATVTAEGIDVPNAALPRGSHRLLLEIQDSLGRTGERLLQFVVE